MADQVMHGCNGPSGVVVQLVETAKETGTTDVLLTEETNIVQVRTVPFIEPTVNAVSNASTASGLIIAADAQSKEDENRAVDPYVRDLLEKIAYLESRPKNVSDATEAKDKLDAIGVCSQPLQSAEDIEKRQTIKPVRRVGRPRKKGKLT